MVPIGSIVPETIDRDLDARARAAAARSPSSAALTLRVSWQVSISRIVGAAFDQRLGLHVVVRRSAR